MESVREQLQVFTRRFGLLSSSCCDECCGEKVSMVQSHILLEVRRCGHPAMQKVSEELGVDITTFSRQVKSLERKGLLRRQTSGEDRRVTLLELTGEGKEILAKIDLYMAERLDSMFSRLTPFERETVTRSLELLNSVVSGCANDEKTREEKIVCCK